jgi:hypothetical protein
MNTPQKPYSIKRGIYLQKNTMKQPRPHQAYFIKKRDHNERIPVSFLKSLLEDDNYNKEEVEKTLIYVENQYSENPKPRKELGLTNFSYSYFHSKYLSLYKVSLT